MLHVHGQSLNEQELERLLEALTDDGGPDAVAVATEISHAYASDRFAVRLDFEAREAIYFVLATEEDLPEGLMELRETLGRHVLALLKIM